MKRLKCIVAVVLCLFILATFSRTRASAEEFTDASAAKLTEVPADVKEFAEKSALPFVKGWLQSSGKIGKYFESAEEIEQLQVGHIFRLCLFKSENDYNKITALSDAIYVSDYWMMLACTPEGEAKWYAMIADKTDEGKGYVVAREANAVALGQALEVFEKINSTNALDVVPTVIWYKPYETIVMEIVDGKEYVITAGTSEPLDKSYIGITDPQYLPTGMDAVEALREVSARPTTNEKGELLLGDPLLFWLTASEQPGVPKSPAEQASVWYVLLIGTGVCVVSAGAVYLVIRGKRKTRMSNER